MNHCVVTIVAGNYLAYARTLGQSLQRASAGVDFHVLIADRRTPALEADVRASGLSAIFADELGLPDAERLFYKYDIVELNTALKPSFLKRQFARGYERVLYLDPDIQVFRPLEPVMRALDDAAIVLTPHALSPAMDGLRPSDVDFLRTGAYNLGFIGLKAGATTAAMLDWWESRCLGMGFNDPAFGVFVDQKWIDLVPSYFDGVRVLRHPGCNVAYWNLHERQLARAADGSCTVNGQPLVFFHFSGVVPTDPSILSRHQTRHQLAAGSVLHGLVAAYCAELLAQDHARLVATHPYGFGRLDDGSAVTPTMRRALLVVPYEESAPFDAGSRLQQDLRRAGISQRGGAAAARAPNTMSFRQDNRQLRWVNRLLRLGLRVLGLPRLLLALQYAGLMTRETHLPAVLLDQPLRLDHRLRR